MPASPQPSLKCLLLAPRGPAFLDIQVSLEQVAAGYGMSLITLWSEVEYGGLVSDAALQVPRTIESADAIIADLTGADPNVMYELGFAHALKKPVLPILRRGESRIPSDLQGYLYFQYGDDLLGDAEFRTAFDRWLRRALRDRGK